MEKDKKKKTKKKDDFTKLKNSLSKILKVRKVEKNELETALAIIRRIGDDRSIKKTLEEFDKTTEELQKAKDIITSVRRQMPRH